MTVQQKWAYLQNSRNVQVWGFATHVFVCEGATIYQ